MKNKMLRLILVFVFAFATLLFSQTIPYQYGWPRQASDDWGLYYNSPTIADFNNDGSLNISVTKSFATPLLYSWKSNGTYLIGFPISLPAGNLQNSGSIEISAAGDVDGDSLMELVFGDENGQIFVVKPNGTMAINTPIYTGATRKSTTPALVDLDEDGKLEIIITTYERESPYNDAKLHVFQWNGNGFSDFAGFPIGFTYGSDSAPVVGDIDNDGKYEIVYVSSGQISDSTMTQLNAINLKGGMLDGFPIHISYNPLGSTPALYDLNKDGNLEIIIKAKAIDPDVNGIFAFDYQGKPFGGFPIPVESGHPFSNVAIADMDGDGEPEIAYGSVMAVDSGKAWAWKLDGTLLPNYPQKIFATWVDGAVALGDVSGDSLPDVIVPTSKGFIYAFDKNGLLVPGFPLQAENVHVVVGFETSPTITDIDGDGDVEIFAGSLNRRVYGWDTPGIMSQNIWSTYKGNAQRTGGMLKGFGTTNIKNKAELINSFSLEQNYPNPFNPVTTIKYSVPSIAKSGVSNTQSNAEADVKLIVYDILGNEVVTLVEEIKAPGNYETKFNAENLSSGIYFYRLQAGGFIQIRKMLLLK